MEKQDVAFETLDNGFRSCADPGSLQQTCDRLGAEDIERLFRKWLDRLPLPLSAQDREAGYDWQLSIWQMEVSLTQVFTRPVRGREFFEEVIRDNFDLGRPDRVQLIFEKRMPAAAPGGCRTRVIQQGVSPSLHIEYRSFNLKQYFKEGKALRTEGTFHNPKDFGVNKGLPSFAYLQQVGRHINRRLLEVERVSQNCGLSADSIERVVQPTVNKDGHKAPGLRFGDPRVMALMLSLALFTHLINGFRNQDLRRSVGQLTQRPYSASQASYDLRRLCRKGLLFRPAGTHRYGITPYGWKVARFFARLDARVFRPALVALDPQSVAAPQPRLARALARVDVEIDALVQTAFPLQKRA
jgi:hypothetical protein